MVASPVPTVWPSTTTRQRCFSRADGSLGGTLSSYLDWQLHLCSNFTDKLARQGLERSTSSSKYWRSNLQTTRRRIISWSF